MIDIIIIICFLIATILFFQFFLRFVYNFKVTNIGIVFTLFYILPIWIIPFNNIIEIKKVSIKDILKSNDWRVLFSLGFGDRIWGDILMIKKKKGIFKIVLMVIGNADDLINAVNKLQDKSKV